MVRHTPMEFMNHDEFLEVHRNIKAWLQNKREDLKTQLTGNIDLERGMFKILDELIDELEESGETEHFPWEKSV